MTTTRPMRSARCQQIRQCVRQFHRIVHEAVLAGQRPFHHLGADGPTFHRRTGIREHDIDDEAMAPEDRRLTGRPGRRSLGSLDRGRSLGVGQSGAIDPRRKSRSDLAAHRTPVALRAEGGAVVRRRDGTPGRPGQLGGSVDAVDAVEAVAGRFDRAHEHQVPEGKARGVPLADAVLEGGVQVRVASRGPQHHGRPMTSAQCDDAPHRRQPAISLTGAWRTPVACRVMPPNDAYAQRLAAPTSRTFQGDSPDPERTGHE